MFGRCGDRTARENADDVAFVSLDAIVRPVGYGQLDLYDVRGAQVDPAIGNQRAEIADGRVVADGTPAQVINERTIGDVFAAPVRVEAHPVTGTPHVVVVPGDGDMHTLGALSGDGPEVNTGD